MPSVLIRNVDEALHRRLKASAVAHRRSLEEEAREILRAGIARQDLDGGREHIVDAARRLFGAAHGFYLDVPPRDRAAGRPPPDFSGDP